MTFPKLINEWLADCRKAVSVIPLFAGIFAFSMFGIFHAWLSATFAAVGAFALVGVAEIIHVNRKAQLVQRRHSSYDAHLMLAIGNKNPLWKVKMLKEFTHGQAAFKVVGFDQKPIPFAISSPLCPRCGQKLVERITVFYPGIIRIKFLCQCGYKCRSKLTLGEVSNEAGHIGNLPTPDKQP